MIQKMSDEIGELIAALCSAQAEMGSIGRDGKNPHFRSQYATLDNILDTVRPILAKNGLVLIQGCKNEQTEKISGLDVTTTLAHKSGQWIATHVYVPVNKQDAHAVGSALTYGRRYGAAAILAISTDNDDDGNAAVPQHRMQQPQPQQVKVTGKAEVTQSVDDATLRKTFFAALKVLHKDITPDTAKEVFIRLMGDVSLSGQALNDAIAIVTGHKTWDEFYQFLESHVVVGGK
jgi:hypothetical protein